MRSYLAGQTSFIRGIWIVPSLAFLLCLLVPDSALFGQISPGDLASAHESMDGITNCTSCHELGEGASPKKCMNCHIGIKERVEQKRGYHYQVVTIEKKACFSCHSEHAGREFKLIVWPEGEKKLDHTLTGFHLMGKHAETECRECHNPANLKDDLKHSEPTIDLTSTFLGLNRDCLSCHRDEHRGQLLADCARCHNNESWKPAAGFNHANASFKLTGKHRQVKCQKCHITIEDPLPVRTAQSTYSKYTGLIFDNCTSCHHKDRHDNMFGQDCENCHQTTGWKKIMTANFDHTKTSFPLTGLHKNLECQKCHADKSKLEKKNFANCTDCHQDYHRGQLADRQDGGRCESCHLVTGFRPAQFTIDRHQQGRFALAGAHLAQACFVCHKPIKDQSGQTFTNFSIEERQCEACHQDIHAGQFVQSGPVKQCSDCHGNDDWQNLTFNHDRDSDFQLTGAHQEVSCYGCHKTVVDSKDNSLVRFRPVDQRCKNCHTSTQKLSALDLP